MARRSALAGFGVVLSEHERHVGRSRCVDVSRSIVRCWNGMTNLAGHDVPNAIGKRFIEVPAVGANAGIRCGGRAVEGYRWRAKRTLAMAARAGHLVCLDGTIDVRGRIRARVTCRARRGCGDARIPRVGLGRVAVAEVTRCRGVDRFFPRDRFLHVTIRFRAALGPFVPGWWSLVMRGQTRKNHVDDAIQMRGAAQILWDSMTFVAIKRVFVVGARRRFWVGFAAMARSTRRNAFFMAPSAVATHEHWTFRTIRAMTNLAILDGVVLVAYPNGVFAAITGVGPARFVITFAHGPIATNFASGEANSAQEKRETFHHDRQGFGAWTFCTSNSAPGPWQVAQASMPLALVIVSACAWT